MSRSNPYQKTPHPCRKWLEWAGDTGNFKVYNKETKKSEAVEVRKILVLDTLHCITGFDLIRKMGYNSNEVKDLSKEPLYLKDGNKDLQVKGLWADIKEALPKGAKYTASVYALIDGELANIKMKGSTLNTWIETIKSVNVEEVGVLLTGNEQKKNGSTTYFVPTFDIFTPTEEENQQAIEADKVLQSYFSSKKDQHPAADDDDDEPQSAESQTVAESQPKIIETDEQESDDLPF